MTAKQLLSLTRHSIYLSVLVALMPASGQADDSSGLVSSLDSTTLAPAENPSLHDWRRTMSKKTMSKAGCFKATHPGSTWQEVPCQSPPNKALAVATKYKVSASGARTSPAISPAAVGNGTDFVATTSQPISWAEGTFPRVTGVTGQGTQYSLQINPAPEPTSGQGLCANAQTPANCRRWQQFLFMNPWIFTQYWLLNYGNTRTVNSGTCSTNPCSNGDYMCPQGWQAGDVNSCVRNGNGYYVNELEGQPLSNLANLALIGHASGTADQVFLSTGNGTLYMASDPGELLNLSQWWNQAEFNVFGWSGSSPIVDLGSNAVVTVQLITDTTPASTPTVGLGGFTFEGNNLTLVPGSQCAFGGNHPGIQFTQGYVGAPSPGCPLPTQQPPVAFQANTNYLYLYNNGQPTNTWLGMYPGTIPSWVMSPTGPLPKIAFQANTGNLFLHDMNTWPPVDTGKFMKAGTSPSMTLIANQYPADKVIVAYQGRSGKLCLYRSDTATEHCTAGDMTGSPSIAWVSNQTDYGNFVVAFHSSANHKCYVYSGSSSSFSKCNSNEPTMWAGTSPSIAAFPNNNNSYTTSFQGSDGYLYLYWPGGGGNQWLGMMPGSSPSVTILHDGTIAYACQANTGFLFTSVRSVITNTQLVPGFPQMAPSASPIILPTPRFGYQVAFEANSTYLYLDDNGTAVNTWQGMNTP